jgi:outer membrane immunogenic protein
MVFNWICRCGALAVGVAVLALAGTARADGPFGQPVFGQPVGPGYDYRFTAPYTWTGFYLGGNIGAGWNSGSFTDNVSGLIFNEDNSGPIGGVQLGYNYQIRTFVIGAEWDADWTSISHRGFADTVAPIGTVQGLSETRWVTTVAARLGVVGESWMAYFKVGGGWVNESNRMDDLTTLRSVSLSGTQSGPLFGGGFAYALTANWISRVEYDFIDLGDASAPGFIANERLGLSHSLQMLKIGLDYKF